MKAGLPILIAFALLLAGCTANPQDLETKTAAKNNSQRANGTLNQGVPPQLTLSATEVAKHSTAENCWMIISGNVYDLSSYTRHPGGSIYVPYCGTDGTVGFQTRGGTGTHSSNAAAQLSSYYMGALGQTIASNMAAQNGTANMGNLNTTRSGKGRGWRNEEDD